MPGLAALLALGLVLASPQGLSIPANDGWVTDRAGMLRPEEERSLEDLMESYRAGSGQEVALLILPDLGGRTIEEVALAVARGWKLGDRETSAGALLVVARDERKLRIEVGRGLEGTLTDSIAGRIIRDVIAPEFKAGRYYPGVRLGIEAIHAALGGDYAPVERARGHSGGAPAVLPGLVFWIVILLLILKRRGRGGVGSALPWILASQIGSAHRGSSGGGRVGGFSGGSFGGFGGGGGFSGGGASGGW